MIRKLLVAAVLLSVACTKEPIDDGLSQESPQPHAARKIINTPVHADKGSLLVYFDAEAVERVEQAAATAAATRSVATRSGIASVDDVLDVLKTSSFRRVFPCNARTEERTRAAGLHRWYLVSFDEEADLEDVARRFASVSEVSRVQFNTRLRLTDGDFRARPLRAATSTPAATATTAFNDPYLSRQWHYHNVGDTGIASTARAGADINASEAWKLTCGHPDIVVAIVDEGVKYSHPDLEANMWVNPAEKNGANGTDDDRNSYVDDLHGYNFVTRGAVSWAEEGDSGHGTHVGGTVAAVNNNGVGVCGVAGGSGNNDGVRLMSCQIFSGNHSGSGSIAVSSEAIKYAADNGASIIQCSWGYDAGDMTSDQQYLSYCGVEKEAIDYFIATKNCAAIDGGLAIFAAGNDAEGMAAYPGAYYDYISVTSFSPDYLPAYYTNYGPGCNIAAPGGDVYLAADYASSTILSTLPPEVNNGENYGYMQGTSMACPHVSGVAALGLSYALEQGKTFTLDAFKAMLLTSVNDIDSGLDGIKVSGPNTLTLNNYRYQMGTGAIDAYQLLMQIEGTPCLKAKVNAKQFFILTSYFGGGAEYLTYTDVTMTPEDMAKLGMTEAPRIAYGKLVVECKKPGVARISVTAIAGGSSVGGGDSMGGQEITKEFAIIARGVQTGNGGWL